MKGKIIVIDNQLSLTRNLVIKEKYVIAHTCNIQMRWFDPIRPFMHNIQAERDLLENEHVPEQQQ
jgi:hypothetical protein